MGPAQPNPPRAAAPLTSEDVLEIHRLKFRYVRALDTKLWEDFAATMIPEATATYSEYLQFESREAFLTFMRNTLGPHVITEHRVDHPEVDVHGDRASGIWYLSDTVLIPENNMLLRGAAFYSDEYVRCDDGRWRIAHTGYERTYEVVLSLSDLPSLRLTANRWGLIQQASGVESVERDPRETATHDETPEEFLGGPDQEYPPPEERAAG
ncbi:nuclear transport factor 2 family protein [Nocardia carnea]|uniref:nuclear transport factor 2 family protein n=1 Tax=Nocardia carnea TaxID=37328 RepID=UPI003D77B75D